MLVAVIQIIACFYVLRKAVSCLAGIAGRGFFAGSDKIND
jgi:hypothetical protein